MTIINSDLIMITDNSNSVLNNTMMTTISHLQTMDMMQIDMKNNTGWHEKWQLTQPFVTLISRNQAVQ